MSEQSALNVLRSHGMTAWLTNGKLYAVEHWTRREGGTITTGHDVVALPLNRPAVMAWLGY